MTETFRPRSNYLWAGCSLILLALFAVNSFIVAESTLQIAFELSLCIALGVSVLLIWVKPKLVLKSDVIEVVNPFTTVKIAYSDVRELETKWVLKIIHTGGETRVWVAPASGKRRWIADKKFGWFGSNLPYSQLGESGTESMSESLDSDSGQAAYMIRERIKRTH